MQSLSHIDVSTLNIIANTIQAKKYGYESKIDIDGKLTNLVQEIFKDKSIVFFESKENAKFYELDTIFGQYVTTITSGYFKNRKIDDEVDLLKSAYKIESGLFNETNLTILKDPDNKALFYLKGKPVDFFNHYEISKKELIANAISSKNIDRIDNENHPNTSFFLLTNQIEYLNKKKIMLSIIGQSVTGVYNLFCPYLFDFDNFRDMELTPVRLFLKLLDYYGMNITIYGETRRFWKYIEVSNYTQQFNENVVRINKKIDPIMFNMMLHTQFADKICFFFGIDYKKYFSELRSGQI